MQKIWAAPAVLAAGIVIVVSAFGEDFHTKTRISSPVRQAAATAVPISSARSSAKKGVTGVLPDNAAVVSASGSQSLRSGSIWSADTQAQASSLSISSAVANPGGTTSLGVSLAVSGTAPAGLEWTIAYLPTQISALVITPGPAATAAAKTLSCTSASGAVNCVLTGMNTNVLGAGVVAYVTVTMASGATSASVQMSNPVGTDSNGNGLSITSAGVGTITVSSLLPLTCSPASLNGSGVGTCTVTMTQASPAGGASVTLISNNTSLTVPASVTVAAGGTTATFSATAAASIASNQTATVTATYGGSSQTASVSLLAPVLVSGLVCNPAALGQSGVGTCTVTMNQLSPAGGSNVTLTSNNTSLTVPASVNVAAGATTATFGDTAAASIPSNQNATVTATLGSSSQTASVGLLAPVMLSGVACNPTTLGQNTTATCTVTINQVSPAGGSNVTLMSNNTSLTVPASVTVAAGATTAAFNATAAASVSTNQNATVTATLGSSSQTATIGLVASLSISSLSCSPASLVQGASSTCTVTTTAASPVGSTIALSSNNNLLTVPASVALAGGGTPGLRQAPSTNAAWNATTLSVSTGGNVTAGDAIAVGLYWSSSQSLTSITGCGSTSFTILNNPTGPGSSVVKFAQAYGFAAASGACKVTATFAGSVGSTAMVVNDVENVAALDCSAAQEQDAPGTGSNGVSSGSCTTTANGDYLLGVLTNGDGNGAIFTAGTNFALEGSVPYSQTEDGVQVSAGTVVATATVTPGYASTTTGLMAFKAAGATTATFSATAAASIAINQNATVTATLGASSQTANVSLVAPILASGVTCNPASLGQSAVAACTVTLNQSAPAVGSSVTLASNNASVSVPPSVTVAAGAIAGTFTATAAASIASNQSATVTAMLGSSSQTAIINLLAPFLVSGISCNPATLGQGAVSTCTVTMAQAAPAGGSTVTLASNNTSLAVPATVTAGATTATFSATAAASIASNQTATVTATLGSSSQTTNVSLLATAAPTATFVNADSTTSGNWLSVYGADGYSVMGDLSANPSYVTPAASGQQYYVWAASSTDLRASQKASNPADRVAATWYTSGSFTVDLNITDQAHHQVALYSLDWDQQGRQQTVAVLDANGNVLDSRTLTNFTGGVYLVWNITGHVQLRVSSTAGPNAAVSGLFFDPAVSTGLVSGVACNPVSLGQNSTGACTVTLTKAAPTGGWGLALASNNPLLTVPASVTVAAGATTTTFTATAAASIASNQSAAVTATLGVNSQTTTVSLVAPPPVPVSGVSCNPATLGQGSVSTCTVTMAQAAPAGGSSVTLASNNTSLAIPATVTVTAGATTATFSATAAATITSNQTATLTATSGSSSQTASVSLLAPAVPTATFVNADSATSGNWMSVYGADGYSVIGDFPTNPAYVTPVASGQQYFMWAASSTDLRASQKPSNPADRVAATWYTSGSFTIDLNIADQAHHQVALYSLDWDNKGRQQTVAVLDPNGNVLDSRSLTNFSGGVYLVWNVTGHVKLRVTLTAGPNATVSGLFFDPALSPGLVSGVACNPVSLGQGSIGNCTVTLAKTAPTGGWGIALASNNPLLGVPPSATVAAGATTATFTATTAASIASNQSAAVTATLGVNSQTTTVSLLAPVPMLVSGISCNPATLGQGAVSTCTVTMAQAAPAGGSTVTLASNNTSLTVPATVTVTAGATTATFSATAAATITSNQTATLTATSGSSSQTASVSLLAPAVPTATFVNADSTTSGNWINVYGADGYSVMGDLSANPSYVTPAVSGQQYFAWAASSTDLRASQKASNPADRVAATWYTPGSFTIDLNITDQAHHQVALYSLDWDNQGRQQNVAILDANGNVLDSRTVTHFTGGVYLVWNVTGHVKLRVTLTAGPNAAVSGLFFDPAVSPGLVSGVACNPVSLGQSSTGACTVTLTKAAPTGGWGIALASNNPLLTVPASVTVAAGATTTTFTTTAAASIATNQSAAVTATLGVNSQTTTVNLLAPVGSGGQANSRKSTSPQSSVGASSLRCSPGTVTAGAAATCELFVTPGSQPVALALHSSSEQLLIPAVVTTRPNQASLTFQARTNPVSRQQSVTITATLGTSKVEDTILLMASAGPALTVPEKQVAKTGTSISFTVSAVDPYGLPVQLEASSIPVGASFDPMTGRLDWAPQSSQAGKYTVTFTATNSARQSSTAHVDVEVDSGLPVLNAPTSPCSPGAIAHVTGKWLAAPGSRLSDPTGASFDLGGTSVAINNQAVPVLRSSADRVDFLCPATAPGTELSVVVTSSFGASQPVTMAMVEASPIILTMEDSSENQGLISFYETNDLVMDRNFKAFSHPAQPGDQIVILATGLGAAADWSGSILVKLSDVLVRVEPVQSVPGYVGVFAIRVSVPTAMTFGNVPVQLHLATPDSHQLNSNIVTAAFEAARQ